MNLYESIKSNLTESAGSDFFTAEGLKIAKELNTKIGSLNNCREVSIAVAKAAKEAGIACEVMDVRVFAAHMTKDSYNSSDELVCMLDSEKLYNKQHTVIHVSDGDYIVDYTQAQYAGSNNAEDTAVAIAKPVEKVVNEIWEPMRIGSEQFFDEKAGILYAA